MQINECQLVSMEKAAICSRGEGSANSIVRASSVHFLGIGRSQKNFLSTQFFQEISSFQIMGVYGETQVSQGPNESFSNNFSPHFGCYGWLSSRKNASSSSECFT